MPAWRVAILCSGPVVYAAEATALSLVAQAPDVVGIRDPASMTVALIAGFTGMLLLNTWIIKYLLMDFRKTIEENTKVVQEASRGRRTIHNHNEDNSS